MAVSKSQRAAINAALDKGDIEGAHAILTGVKDAAATAAANPATPPAPPEPRKVEAVILDLFRGVHQLLGNTPALVPLINELSELVTPPAAEESPAK